MNNQPHILLVGNDPSLAAEFEPAIAALRKMKPILRSVAAGQQAVEAARSWRPQLALVDMQADLAPLKTLAREIQLGAPETAVVGVFRPDIFSHEAQESVLLIDAVRAGVRDFLRRPPSSADLEALLERLLGAAPRTQAHLGKVITFLSNKGGVGKSTLAVNTACELARRHPQRVLLVDASLQIGSCASMLDLHPAATLADAARQCDRLDETLLEQLTVVHPSGLHLLAAPHDAVESADVTDEIVSRVLSLARRSYDYVVVDTFPLLDRVAVAVLDLSDAVYIVFENTVPTLLGIVKLLDLFRNLGVSVERQRLVLNRFQNVLGNPRAAEVSQRLGRDLTHTIGYDSRFVTAANMGEPYLARAGRFRSARRQLLRLIDEIDRLPSQPGSIPFARTMIGSTVSSELLEAEPS
jgi:pilus assembly protein CpaE